MLDLSPLALGIALVFIGLAVIALTLLFTRLIRKRRNRSKLPGEKPVTLSNPQHDEAVLIIQSGGRVNYLNEHARVLFNLHAGHPNLESLARRTRPSETFLALCAHEGQARFYLNGRSVEGISYRASFNGINNLEEQDFILVSLRRPKILIESPTAQASPSGEYPGVVSSQAFTIIAELTQRMASSLNLEDAIQTILESVERLIPSDFLEIAIWEDEYQHLAPYRLEGSEGGDRRLAKGPERYHTNQGFSGYLFSEHKSLLIPDVNSFQELRPALDRGQYPFHSYLGVPLLLAGAFVGTLELACLDKNAYSKNDLDILHLLTGQAAVAIMTPPYTSRNNGAPLNSLDWPIFRRRSTRYHILRNCIPN